MRCSDTVYLLDMTNTARVLMPVRVWICMSELIGMHFLCWSDLCIWCHIIGTDSNMLLWRNWSRCERWFKLVNLRSTVYFKGFRYPVLHCCEVWPTNLSAFWYWPLKHSCLLYLIRVNIGLNRLYWQFFFLDTWYGLTLAWTRFTDSVFLFSENRNPRPNWHCYL